MFLLSWTQALKISDTPKQSIISLLYVVDMSTWYESKSLTLFWFGLKLFSLIDLSQPSIQAGSLSLA